MTYSIMQFNGVVTVWIEGRVDALELAQNPNAVLDEADCPAVVLVDLSLARELGQAVKANLLSYLNQGQQSAK